MREADADETSRAIRRVTRELHRLEALQARRRFRVRVLRGLRGVGGAGAALVALVKFKVAASLGVKVGLAVLVGVGLAWPFVALGILALMSLVAFIVGVVMDEGDLGGCDCPDDSRCKRRESRAARLKQAIATRRAWLASVGAAV